MAEGQPLRVQNVVQQHGDRDAPSVLTSLRALLEPGRASSLSFSGEVGRGLIETIGSHALVKAFAVQRVKTVFTTQSPQKVRLRLSAYPVRLMCRHTHQISLAAFIKNPVRPSAEQGLGFEPDTQSSLKVPVQMLG